MSCFRMVCIWCVFTPLHPTLVPSIIGILGPVIRCVIIMALVFSGVTLLMILRARWDTEVPPPVIEVVVPEELLLDCC